MDKVNRESVWRDETIKERKKGNRDKGTWRKRSTTKKSQGGYIKWQAQTLIPLCWAKEKGVNNIK